MICDHLPWTRKLAYGHQFHSFCLIARPTVILNSVESVAYAIQRGLCSYLDVEESDIGVSWRWLSRRRSQAKAEAEIILYDNTPGGAGFVKHGFENWTEIIASGINICSMCRCDSACYDCLKGYGNQVYHEKLNRFEALHFFCG